MLDFEADLTPYRTDNTISDVTTGIVAGTRVATQIGWCAIEAVVVGDKVLTFDAGLQPVIGVTRQIVWTEGALDHPSHWPLHVPTGALGNRSDMTLLPQQAILIESDIADEVFGDPFALIPALALDGFRGISHTTPRTRFEVITLQFAQDEVIFANIGALFFCPAKTDILLQSAPSPYSVLELDAADALVGALEFEDTARGTSKALPSAAAVAA